MTNLEIACTNCFIVKPGYALDEKCAPQLRANGAYNET